MPQLGSKLTNRRRLWWLWEALAEGAASGETVRRVRPMCGDWGDDFMRISPAQKDIDGNKGNSEAKSDGLGQLKKAQDKGGQPQRPATRGRFNGLRDPLFLPA